VAVPACNPLAAAEAAQRIREADARRDAALRDWTDSSGARGVAPRELSTAAHRHEASARAEEIPGPILEAIAAREQYLHDVPLECEDADRAEARNEYVFYVGDRFYAYRHFSEARAFLEPLYARACETSPLGYETWKRLLTMSVLEHDDAESRRLAVAQRDHPCVGTHDEPNPGGWDDTPISALDDADKVFASATHAAEGTERNLRLRKAAQMYEDVLTAAPAHHAAPDCAMRAAWSYAQIGETNGAIRIYRIVTENYVERFDLLPAAYEALSAIYLSLFAYDRAAGAFAQMAVTAGFDPTRRARAALVAMELYSGLGDRENLTRMHDIANRETDPADGDRARADYLLAHFDFVRWAEAGPTTAEASRRSAIAALVRFEDAYRGLPSAAAYVLEAADRVALMKTVHSSQAAHSPESPGILGVIPPAGLPAPSPSF
jgi:hypothetical protein